MRNTLPSELVLDPMMGSDTTLVECKLLGRHAVGVDINPDAVMVARNRLDFTYAMLDADYVGAGVVGEDKGEHELMICRKCNITIITE